MVRQRPAKPLSPVRIRASPPGNTRPGSKRPGRFCRWLTCGAHEGTYSEQLRLTTSVCDLIAPSGTLFATGPKCPHLRTVGQSVRKHGQFMAETDPRWPRLRTVRRSVRKRGRFPSENGSQPSAFAYSLARCTQKRNFAIGTLLDIYEHFGGLAAFHSTIFFGCKIFSN